MKLRFRKIILCFLISIFLFNVSGCFLPLNPPTKPDDDPPSSDEVTEEAESQILKIAITKADGTAFVNNKTKVNLSDKTLEFKVEVTKVGNISSAVTVTSSDTALATVSNNKITFKKAGTAVITARSNADETKATTLSVEIEEVMTVSIRTAEGNEIADDELSHPLNGGDFDLIVAVNKTSDTDYETTLTSSDPSVASVLGRTITPKKVGTTILTATLVKDKSITHSITLDIAIANEIFSVKIKDENNEQITDGTLTRKVSGGTFDLNVEVLKSGKISSDITLTSSNASVASVSGKTVTPKMAGTTTLTAKSTADPTKTHSVVLTVPAEILSIKIKTSSNEEITGDELSKPLGLFNLMVSVQKTGTIDSSYTLTSSNPSVATVNGLTITPMLAGITLLTARSTIDTSIVHTVRLQITATRDNSTLKGAYAEIFPIGAAVTKHTIDRFDPSRPGSAYYGSVDLMKHYNSLVAESAMKWSNISKVRGVYVYNDSTFYVDPIQPILDYAISKNMYMRAHGLIWYKSTPQWIKTAGAGGGVPTKEELKEIMREHIYKVVDDFAQYPNIYCWDVVNEALQPWINNQADLDDGYYRTGTTDVDNMGSYTFDWYKYYDNSPEFIVDAFKFAREAADNAGRTDIKLYYNDYSLDNPLKREALLNLIQYLKDNDAPIDAVGMQSHYNAVSFDLDDYEDSVDAILATGLDLQSTEIDISMYSWSDSSSTFGTMPPAGYEPSAAVNGAMWTYNVSDGQGAVVLARQNEIYKDIFATLRERATPSANRGRVTGITFWTIGDEFSWLNWEPEAYRPSFAGLFDYQRQPKSAFYDIVNF